MGRLIDEDELIKGRAGNDPVVIAAKCAPTAYNSDKVIQQIKELSIRERGEIKTEDVITIVKGGGVNAD